MKPTDLSRLEHQITAVLRIGVALSASALTMGLVMFFAHVRGSEVLLKTGLILLMAIPVTRIVASFVDAVRRRDYLLMWSTAFVLLVMAATLAYSLRS